MEERMLAQVAAVKTAILQNDRTNTSPRLTLNLLRKTTVLQNTCSVYCGKTQHTAQ